MAVSKYTRLLAPAVVVVIVVVLATGLSGCDQGDPDPDTTPLTIVRPEAMPATPAAPPAVIGEGNYEVMCRHYCRTLEETLLFLCAGSGGQVATCRETAGATAGRCYELRCAPRLVEPSLCFTQCDSLARQYEPYCANAATAAAELCTATPADHDRACREGCGPL